MPLPRAPRSTCISLVLWTLLVAAQAREPAAGVAPGVDLRRQGAPFDVAFVGNASRLPALLGANSAKDLAGSAGPSAEFFRTRYPHYRQFRVGNLFFGYACAGMDFEELAVRGANGRIEYRFGQTLEMLQRLVAAGIKPHLALTGTPLALVPTGETPLKHPAYGCVNAPAIDWSKAQPRERMSEWWALQDAFFKALIERFGKAEVQGWTLATWTEPLNPKRSLAHLVLPEEVVRDGRHDEAVATIIAASIDAAMQHGLRIRLGNMAGAVEQEYPKLVREIGRFARGKAYLDYIDGYAISRYRTQVRQDIARQLDAAFTLLRDPAMPAKPLYVDELGDLAGADGAEPFAPAAGLDGARFIAAALERVYNRQYEGPRRPRSVAFWGDQIAPRARQTYARPQAYLQSATGHVLDMFASLAGHARLAVSGPAGQVVAGADRGRLKAILIVGAGGAGRLQVSGLNADADYALDITEVSRSSGNPISAFLDGAPGQAQDTKGRFALDKGRWKLASPHWEACFYDEDASCAWRERGRAIEAPAVRHKTLRSDATGRLLLAPPIDGPAIVMLDLAPAR